MVPEFEIMFRYFSVHILGDTVLPKICTEIYRNIISNSGTISKLRKLLIENFEIVYKSI